MENYATELINYVVAFAYFLVSKHAEYMKCSRPVGSVHYMILRLTFLATLGIHLSSFSLISTLSPGYHTSQLPVLFNVMKYGFDGVTPLIKIINNIKIRE